MHLKFKLTTWEEILKKIYSLGKKIKDSGYKPDVIVSILRGGAIPTAILSDVLGVQELYSIRIKLYEGVGKVGEKPQIVQGIPNNLNTKKVLIVDDVSDTGKTIAKAVEYIKELGASEIRVATIHLKPWSSFIPHYYVEITDHWIIYPWEYIEFIEEMKTRISKGDFSEDEALRIREVIRKIKEILNNF